MSFDAHSNFALTRIAVAPVPADSGTALGVDDASVFPAPPFNVTVAPQNVLPTSANAEILRVTGIAGNTLTVSRAQEGSTAKSIVIGWLIDATITKKTLTDIEAQALGGTVTGVTGTAPIASSGGVAPIISIPKATGAADGYLAAADWTTFNAKQPAGTYVTAVSIAPANGFAGSSSGGVTPALTLSTSIAGILKGNATAISAAGAGTDYVAPSAYASTNGLTMSTARLLGRTTAATGDAEEISVGTGLSLSAGSLNCTVTAPVGANPTGTIGLSAVNGSAATFLRSDGAPALSQAIIPTWTGLHTFSTGIATTVINGATPATGLLVGGPSQIANGNAGSTPIFQFQDNHGEAGIGLFNYFNDANPAILRLFKSRSATLGTQTAINSTDLVGQFAAYGSDGTNWVRVGAIRIVANGTIGTNSIPGDIVLMPAASNAYNEGLRVNSGLRTILGGLTDDGANRLQVSGAGYFSTSLLVGTTTALQSTSGTNPATSIAGITSGAASVLQSEWSNDSGVPTYVLGKSRGAAVGTHSAVQSGDLLGVFNFLGSDGTAFIRAGQIRCSATTNATTGSLSADVIIYTSTANAYNETARFKSDLSSVFAGTISTAAPAGASAGNWKLGSVVTGLTLTADLTSAVYVDIGGTVYKLLKAA